MCFKRYQLVTYITKRYSICYINFNIILNIYIKIYSLSKNKAKNRLFMQLFMLIMHCYSFNFFTRL